MKFLKYYVLFDLEATCWEGDTYINSEYKKEVIEIGAVKITPEFDILPDEFSKLVRPKVNPEISDYCQKLTGIRKDAVEFAKDFEQVYNQFIEWSGQPMLWMSWSDDYSLIKKECEVRDIKPFNQKRFMDARDIMKVLRGKSAEGMDRELKTYELSFEDEGLRRHRGLDDSIMTANILKRAFLRSRGWTG